MCAYLLTVLKQVSIIKNIYASHLQDVKKQKSVNHTEVVFCGIRELYLSNSEN